MKRYFKLGKKASSFMDPMTNLKLSGNSVGFIEVKPTAKISRAITHGHIVEIKEDEYNKVKGVAAPAAGAGDPPSMAERLSKLTADALTQYYKDNYEVSAEDVKAFNKMTKAEKVSFLLEADTEGDEGEGK